MTGGTDYEAKAREVWRDVYDWTNYDRKVVLRIAAALAKSAAEMRERCEAIARSYVDRGSLTKSVGERIADAIAALKAAGET